MLPMLLSVAGQILSQRNQKKDQKPQFAGSTVVPMKTGGTADIGGLISMFGSMFGGGGGQGNQGLQMQMPSLTESTVRNYAIDNLKPPNMMNNSWGDIMRMVNGRY